MFSARWSKNVESMYRIIFGLLLGVLILSVKEAVAGHRTSMEVVCGRLAETISAEEVAMTDAEAEVAESVCGRSMEQEDDENPEEMSQKRVVKPQLSTSKKDQKLMVKDSLSDADPQSATQKGAKLQFEEVNHNFGDVARKGGDLVYEFKFRNEGNVPLVVTRVITSCSCLKANYSKRPVAPQEEGVLKIVYEPHKSEPGRFNKVIRVYSNSTTRCDLVTVQGNSLEEDHVRKIKNGKVKLKIK